MTDHLAPPDDASDADEVAEDAEEELEWPFGFIAVIALAALYLLWRLIQLGGRAFDWLF